MAAATNMKTNQPQASIPTPYSAPLALLLAATSLVMLLAGCSKGSLENLSEKDIEVPAGTQVGSRHCCGGLEEVAKIDQKTIDEIRHGRQDTGTPGPQQQK